MCRRHCGRQVRLQELAGVGARLVDETFGSAAEEDFAAFVAAFGAEVDDVVRLFDDIHMVHEEVFTPYLSDQFTR